MFASAVSAWEVELKRALGKLEAPDDLEAQLRRLRFLELPLRARHAAHLRHLPPLHRDPFDRMLLAQALADDLILVSRDERVLGYRAPNPSNSERLIALMRLLTEAG